MVAILILLYLNLDLFVAFGLSFTSDISIQNLYKIHFALRLCRYSWKKYIFYLLGPREGIGLAATKEQANAMRSGRNIEIYLHTFSSCSDNNDKAASIACNRDKMTMQQRKLPAHNAHTHTYVIM